MQRSASFVLVVSGTSGSGKSTLLTGLAQRLGDVGIREQLLHFDDFATETDLSEADIGAWIDRGGSPDEWRTPELEERLAEMREGAAEPIGGRTVVLLEEPFGRARSGVRALSDYSIHLSLPPHTALARRLLRQFVPAHGSLSDTGLDDLRTYLVRYLDVGSSFYSAVEAAALAHSDLVLDATLNPASVVEEALSAVLMQLAG